jgi:hypothetical protein
MASIDDPKSTTSRQLRGLLLLGIASLTSTCSSLTDDETEPVAITYDTICRTPVVRISVLRTRQRVQSPGGGFAEIKVKAARPSIWATLPLVELVQPLVEAAQPSVEAARPLVTPPTASVHKIFFLYLPISNRLARNLISWKMTIEIIRISFELLTTKPHLARKTNRR